MKNSNALPVLKNINTVSVTTRMNGKMMGLVSINTSPQNNKFCQAMRKRTDAICEDCYSCKMMNMYPNADRRFQNNGRLLSETDIDPKTVKIPKKNDIVRFDAHGEIHNKKNLENYVKIVLDNPTKQFTLWTKNPVAVNYFKHNTKPDNLILIHSSEFKNKRDALPIHFDKVFTVYTKDFLQDDAIDIDINCGAKSCDTCRKCYTKTDKDTFINEVLK